MNIDDQVKTENKEAVADIPVGENRNERAAYSKAVEAVGRWLDDEVSHGGDNWVIVSAAYGAYLDWCAEKGEKAIPQDTWLREMELRGMRAEDETERLNRWVYKGLELKTESRPEPIQLSPALPTRPALIPEHWWGVTDN